MGRLIVSANTTTDMVIDPLVELAPEGWSSQPSQPHLRHVRAGRGWRRAGRIGGVTIAAALGEASAPRRLIER